VAQISVGGCDARTLIKRTEGEEARIYGFGVPEANARQDGWSPDG